MRILIAVENQHYAEAQVDFATNHKWPEKVMFNILHVVEPTHSEDFPGHQSQQLIADIAASKMKRGEELVKSVSDRLRKTFSAAVMVEDVQVGYPQENILQVVKDWEADVAVVGSHGRRELDRVVAGSVSQAILAHAPCSVFVVRPSREQAAARQAALKDSMVSTS